MVEAAPAGSGPLRRTFLVPEIKSLDQYDFSRAKAAASLAWVLRAAFGGAGNPRAFGQGTGAPGWGAAGAGGGAPSRGRGNNSIGAAQGPPSSRSLLSWASKLPARPGPLDFARPGRWNAVGGGARQAAVRRGTLGSEPPGEQGRGLQTNFGCVGEGSPATVLCFPPPPPLLRPQGLPAWPTPLLHTLKAYKDSPNPTQSPPRNTYPSLDSPRSVLRAQIHRPTAL